MNLHSLENSAGARRPRKRVGRGEASGKGKTCGRGTKGQGSRSGSGYDPAFEGGQMPLYRRLPKFGFKNRNRKAYNPVNVGDLNGFDAGTDVTPALLRETGLVNGKIKRVKILGTGDLDRKLNVTADAFSVGAKKKIEDAGGTAIVA